MDAKQLNIEKYVGDSVVYLCTISTSNLISVLKLDVVSQAKGSAYIECGKTKVIVSVFDPHEIPKRSDYSLTGELYCEFKFASFSCPKRRLHQQDAEEKQNSVIMKRTHELYCRC